MPAEDVSGVLLNPSAREKAWVASMIADRSTVFVNRPQPDEIFAGTNARLAAIAAEKGYRSEMLRVITDSNGRPRFQVFQFVADGR
jgi:hypothetical protein